MRRCRTDARARTSRSPPGGSRRSSRESTPKRDGDRRARISAVAAFRRLPFPHGRDALARSAAAQRHRHAARRHRAVGRTEAASDPRSGGRARASLLRSRRVAGPARRPQPCRRLRRPPARGRGAARGEEAGRALSRPAARRVSAGRLLPLADRSARTSSGRSTWASTSSAAFRISSARWPTAPRR